MRSPRDGQRPGLARRAPAPSASDPPDLRLAGLAIAAWLAALAGLYLPAGASLLIAAIAAVVAAAGAAHLAGLLGRPPASVRRYGWTAIAVLLSGWCAERASPPPG